MAKMVEWAEKCYNSSEANDAIGSDVLKSWMGLDWWSGELKDCNEVEFWKHGNNGYRGSIVRPIKGWGFQSRGSGSSGHWVHELGLSFGIDEERWWMGLGQGSVMQGRNLNGSLNRRWLSLNKIHLNHHIECGGAGMSFSESCVAGEAICFHVEATGAMASCLPFPPLNIPTICPSSAPSWNTCFTLLPLKSSVPLLSPSFDPSQKACFQTRPNGESSDDVVRMMSFARLSSDTGGCGNDAAAVFDANTGTGSDTAGGAWFTGFFFDVVFFSGMVTCGR